VIIIPSVAERTAWHARRQKHHNIALKITVLKDRRYDLCLFRVLFPGGGVNTTDSPFAKVGQFFFERAKQVCMYEVNYNMLIQLYLQCALLFAFILLVSQIVPAK